MNKDGILLIDKPPGLTSHDVVARVRKLLGQRRVGHTGTLDPFATGLLVICVNRATRLAQFLSGEDKEYQAVARFGFATDTGDLTGTPLSTPSEMTHLTLEKLDAAATQLRGHIQQIPPMYSAKKVGGAKLYELARRGEQIERRPVEVEIKELEIEAQLETPTGSTGRDFALRVVCSAGTYVRVLAEDLGKRLGSSAHLTALRRTRVGQFRLLQAITLERLAELSQTHQAEAALFPMSAALAFPAIQVEETKQRALAHGQALRCKEAAPEGTLAKLCNARGELLAVAQYKAKMQGWHPCVVLCEPPGR